MMVHVLRRELELPIGIDAAWSFFSTPRNLALITPPELGLRIVEPFDERPAHDGQLLRYSVRPLLGIPIGWLTRIENVEAPYRFVDLQVRGPYAYWRHEHLFSPIGSGVRMTDSVEYALPLGALGSLAHATFVRRKLNRIFDHREAALSSIFRG